MPEPAARLSKMQIPEAEVVDKNPGFIPRKLPISSDSKPQGSSNNSKMSSTTNSFSDNKRQAPNTQQKVKTKKIGRNKSSPSKKNEVARLEEITSDFF